MKRKDLLLLSSAIGAGLLSASTKSNSPVFSNWALVFSGISAYLATAPRISHKTRMEDLIGEKPERLERLQKAKTGIGNASDIRENETSTSGPKAS
jgi:hypothetical protein